MKISVNLFELGRLQFAFGKANCDVTGKGDNVIEVHISAEGPLIKEECEKSFDKAKNFLRNSILITNINVLPAVRGLWIKI